MARVFEVPQGRELDASPRHHGEVWNDRQKHSLFAMFRQDADLDGMCRTLGRTRIAVLAKLVGLGLLTQCAGGTYAYNEPRPAYAYSGPDHFLEKCPTVSYQPITQPTEENIMATPVIEIKTFIAGQDASCLTDMQIFQRIGKMEETMETLKSIKSRPEKLKAHLHKMKEDIAALVAYVDGRDDAPESGTVTRTV